MARYIERSLGAGEEIVAEAHFHWWYTVKAVLALVFLAWVLIGFYIFFRMMIRKWTTEIGITSHRLVKKTGFLSLKTAEVALPNIEGVRVNQTILGRIFGYGTVRVEGTGVDSVTTPPIADPVGFVRAIQTAREHTAARFEAGKTA